ALFRALQEDPDDRYPDTATFAAALMDALTPRPRRRPALLAGAGLVLVLIGLGVVARGSGSLAREENDAAPPEELAAERVTRSEELRRLVAEADRHAALHERSQAVDLYTQAIRLAPNDP